MKIRTLALCAALIAPMGACNTINGVLHPSPSVQLSEAKALYVANVSLDQAAKAVEQANNAGLLSPANKALAASILKRASDALDAAGTAEKAGQAADVAAQLALFSSLISQINNLIHGA